MPTPLDLLADPVTLTMLAMFAALALAEHLFPGRPLPQLTDAVPEAFARDFHCGTPARPIGASMRDGFVAERLNVTAHPWRGTFDGFIADDLSARLVEYVDEGHAVHLEGPRHLALDPTRFVTSTAASAAIA